VERCFKLTVEDERCGRVRSILRPEGEDSIRERRRDRFVVRSVRVASASTLEGSLKTVIALRSALGAFKARKIDAIFSKAELAYQSTNAQQFSKAELAYQSTNAQQFSKAELAYQSINAQQTMLWKTSEILWHSKEPGWLAYSVV
jgi:hypothetical protein